MSRVIAAYDLDEDHGRLWVNADLKRMPEIVVVANQPMDRAQTVTYVPETKLLEAMDAAREARRRADMAERFAADHKGLCDSLRETNDDLRRIIDELRETEGPADENDRLRTQLADVTESMGRVEERCAKLRELACHLWYVKPRGVTSVLVEGRLVDLEELMEGVGLRWEDA